MSRGINYRDVCRWAGTLARTCDWLTVDLSESRFTLPDGTIGELVYRCGSAGVAPQVSLCLVPSWGGGREFWIRPVPSAAWLRDRLRLAYDPDATVLVPADVVPWPARIAAACDWARVPDQDAQPTHWGPPALVLPGGQRVNLSWSPGGEAGDRDGTASCPLVSFVQVRGCPADQDTPCRVRGVRCFTELVQVLREFAADKTAED